MARILVAASTAFDLTGAAAGLGRAAGAALGGAAYAWTSPAGLAWRADLAPGALRLAPDGAPSGAASRLRLGPPEAPLLDLAAETGALPLDLAALAGPAPAAADGLDPALAGADEIRVDGPGFVLFAADGVLARDRAAGADDRLLAAGHGERRLSGDVILAALSAGTVAAGDDRIVARTSGATALWGDALRLVERSPGGRFEGGDDRLVATGVGDVPRLLIGDAGTVEGGWTLAASADALKGGRGRDGLVGDAVSVGPGARVEGGDDRLRGGGGDDVLHGDVEALRGGVLAPGDDTLQGGRGDDLLVGDVRRRDPGSRLEGGGSDALRGGAGDDRLRAGPGRDAADGGAGRDRLDGGRGRDRMDGEGGADRLDGGPGRDRLEGGAGRDRLEGGRGDDRLAGGAGADLFRFRRGDGHDEIADFRPGKDALHPARGLDPFEAEPIRGGVRLVSEDVTVDLPGVTSAELAALDPDWLA